MVKFDEKSMEQFEEIANKFKEKYEEAKQKKDVHRVFISCLKNISGTVDEILSYKDKDITNFEIFLLTSLINDCGRISMVYFTTYQDENEELYKEFNEIAKRFEKVTTTIIKKLVAL